MAAIRMQVRQIMMEAIIRSKKLEIRLAIGTFSLHNRVQKGKDSQASKANRIRRSVPLKQVENWSKQSPRQASKVLKPCRPFKTNCSNSNSNSSKFRPSGR